MKRTLLCAFLAGLMLLPVIAFGQHELVIPKPTTGTDFLNDKIMGDTTAAGQRKDVDRVFVLERGGIYFLRTAITNNKPSAWPLRIKAQDGAGQRPIIYMIRNTTTNTNPGTVATISANLWLKDLIISGYLEPDTTTFANMPGGLINTAAAGKDIVIDGCIMTNTSGQMVRTDQAPRLVKITNSVLANNGFLGTSNLGAGKGVDARAGSVDSLILINNTIVNVQDRVLRHYSSTLSIKVLVFDHNTVVNCMSYHGLFSLGKVGKNVNLTNNLLIDPFALGNDTDKTRQAEFADSKEKDIYGGNRMTWLISEPNDTTKWVVKNNVYSISADGDAFFTKYKTAGVTGEGSPLTWHVAKKLGADSVNAFKKASVALPKIPKLMVAMMDWYRSPAGGNKTKNTPTNKWTRWRHDFDRKIIKYYTDTMNCAYATTLAAYTGADGGFPVGDLNWFPTKKAAWLTDVKETSDAMPNSMALYQNFPNPFNPTTQIAFNLAKAEFTTLSIYNILGQKVATPVAQKLSAGRHEIRFDASALANGVYFYQLESGNQVNQKKMLLIK
jgi:hypothetical protein